MITKRNAKHRRTARAGMCLTGAVLGTAALTVAYTDAMTSIVARRRSPLAAACPDFAPARSVNRSRRNRCAWRRVVAETTNRGSLADQPGRADIEGTLVPCGDPDVC